MAELNLPIRASVSERSREEVIADVDREHIRYARRADELGWHPDSVIKHQNSPVGRITAPSIYLTAAA